MNISYVPELGHVALLFALALALLQSIIPLYGAWVRNIKWMSFGPVAARIQCLLLVVSTTCLAVSFLDDDFSVLYVASNSNSALPWYYKISAVWGAHEGSMLLWVLILAVWSALVSFFSKQLPLIFVARVLAVMGLISLGFLLFIEFTSNPFERLLPNIPNDGRDLNPMLQDFGLIIHPPILYMGYVGFSVAFAFAIAALLGGQLDSAWARWSRPWTLMAWAFLTLGIAMGSWWAYYELGWGGWWFWDPVENASLMPWLVGTALFHSLIATEKRGIFKSWTVLLAIAAFSLSLLGTFLVRSGVLTSVHAFANDPERGFFIVVFLVLVVGASLTLYAVRVPSVRSHATFSFASRETFILINNLILLACTGTVLLGTLYPLIVDAMTGNKLSVGPPYFNALFVPLMAMIMLAITVAVLMRWKSTQMLWLGKTIAPILWVGLLIGTMLLMMESQWQWQILLVFMLWYWLFAGFVRDLWMKLRHAGVRQIFRLPLRFWGMHLAHNGLAISAVGIVMVSYYSQEMDTRMHPGSSVQLSGHTFVMQSIQQVQGQNYDSYFAVIDVYKENQNIATLNPEKRLYRAQQIPMTEAGIDAGIMRDLYIALGEPLENDFWAVRIQVKPFMRWVWGGALIMTLGSVLALMDKRLRSILRRKQSDLDKKPEDEMQPC